MSLDTPFLLALPTELLLKILMYLPDLHSILSASSTCERIREIYRNSVLQIMRSLIAQTGDPHSTHSIYRRLQILGVVINMFKRKEALSLLKDGWKLFATSGYEQFLIPFGVALARLCVSKESEAVRLLLHILHHKQPFTWRGTSSDLLFIPLRMHLHRLSPKTYPRPSKEDLAEFRKLPVATIGPGMVDWGATMDKAQQAALLKRGIQFQNGLIIVKLDPSYYTEYRHRSLPNELSPYNREEILNHDWRSYLRAPLPDRDRGDLELYQLRRDSPE
uniref:F-box domain-containing protein n=1 Tax=Talaromyces marneffei PM1 TaxID=1077442 RepID=A0A093XSL7_TALMA